MVTSQEMLIGIDLQELHIFYHLQLYIKKTTRLISWPNLLMYNLEYKNN